jgi:hypothetical protein
VYDIYRDINTNRPMGESLELQFWVVFLGKIMDAEVASKDKKYRYKKIQHKAKLVLKTPFICRLQKYKITQ